MKPDHMRLAQPAGGRGDPQVAVLRVGAQAVGLEVGLVQVADGEDLGRRGGRSACGAAAFALRRGRACPPSGRGWGG